MPSNNWGEYSNNTGVSAEPVYPPSAAPDQTGDLTPPQSPSGALSADAPPPQFDTGEMITQQFLSTIGENIPQQGTPVVTVQPHIAGVPDSQIAWNNWTGGTPGNKLS
jgi:hypothetical protein